VTAQIKEINDFATVLEVAIPAHDVAVIDLAVDTIGRELRDLTEQFPDRRDPTVTDGLKERLAARAILKDTVILFRRIGTAAAAGRFDEAAAQFENYRKLSLVALPQVLANAQQWSLFNPMVHRAHYAALWQNLRQAVTPAHALAAPVVPTADHAAKPVPLER